MRRDGSFRCNCPQCAAVYDLCPAARELEEIITDLTRERDEARALLREVAQGELLSPAMGAFMDIQLPMQVWIAVRKAAQDGR